MRSLRILMVTRSLPYHGLGGMEAIAWDLARAFAAGGADVTVLTTACPSLSADSVIDGVRIRCLDVSAGRYSSAWWRESAAVFTRDYAHAVDIVLSVSAGARAMISRRKGASPLFFMQAHGTAWGELVSKFRQMQPLAWAKAVRNIISMWEDRAFRRFDGVISVGHQVARDFERYPTKWIIGDLPVHLVENGVDPNRFAFDPALRLRLRRESGLPDDATVVLSASRLHAQKGLIEAIEGFSIAADREPNLHYVIAGSGPDEARLRARARGGRHASRIHFIGSIPRDQLAGWLSAADVFLFTTKRAEGLPLNILEARAAGLPVIAAKQVSDSRFGSIPVTPEDAQAVAKELVILSQASHADRSSLLPVELTLEDSVKNYLNIFRAGLRYNPRSSQE